MAYLSPQNKWNDEYPWRKAVRHKTWEDIRMLIIYIEESIKTYRVGWEWMSYIFASKNAKFNTKTENWKTTDIWSFLRTCFNKNKRTSHTLFEMLLYLAEEENLQVRPMVLQGCFYNNEQSTGFQEVHSK